MTSHRAAAVVRKDGPEFVSQDLPIVSSFDFQFAPASHCSVSLAREITAFLDTQNTSHPFQFPQWSGKGTCFALLRRQQELRWFAQCGVFYPAGRVVPIRALSVNRGPVCDDVELMEAGLHRLVEESRRQGFAFIDIAPEWTGDFAESAAAILVRNGWRALPGARSSLRLDLRPGVDQLLASFRKVTRYEIRRAERQEMGVRMASNESDCEQWLRLYLKMAAEKQFAAEDSKHVRQVLCWLVGERDRGGLLLAHKDGGLVGGIVIVRSGARCWYLLGATTRDSRFSVGHLLQWRAIQWAKGVGCLEYDFGGYREGASSGPAFFKSGFCGNVVNFPSSHRYFVSPARHRATTLVSWIRRKLLEPKARSIQG